MVARSTHMPTQQQQAEEELPSSWPPDVPHPAQRAIWTDRSGHYRVAALDWADGHPATYQALVRHGALWHAASGPELWRVLVALAAWLDTTTQSPPDS